MGLVASLRDAAEQEAALFHPALQRHPVQELVVDIGGHQDVELVQAGRVEPEILRPDDFRVRARHRRQCERPVPWLAQVYLHRSLHLGDGALQAAEPPGDVLHEVVGQDKGQQPPAAEHETPLGLARLELAQLLGENRAEQLDDPQPLLAHGLPVPGHPQAAVAEPGSEVAHLRRSRVGLGVGRLLQGQVDQVVPGQVAEVPHRGLARNVVELVLPVVSLVRTLEQLKIDVHAAPSPAVSARTAGAGGPGP